MTTKRKCPLSSAGTSKKFNLDTDNTITITENYNFNELKLTFFEKEPRFDSRLFSKGLGVKSKTTNQLIKRHQIRLKKFGLLPFEMERVKKNRGHKYEKYFLLNESQSIFLVTLFRNSERALNLKEKITREFMFYRNQYLKKARQAEMRSHIEWQQTRHDGKQTHSALTDSTKRYVEHAIKSGSKNANQYHKSIPKMINDVVFGIKKAPSNFRDTLSQESLKHLQIVEFQAAKWLDYAIETCTDYHEPYYFIKEKLITLVGVIGRITPKELAV